MKKHLLSGLCIILTLVQLYVFWMLSIFVGMIAANYSPNITPFFFFLALAILIYGGIFKLLEKIYEDKEKQSKVKKILFIVPILIILPIIIYLIYALITNQIKL